ncbi:replication protein [Peribacillus loiseleuriae]|uniref:replication protein n=1 Tax=Peribacillus loiseleuriae TaxID=1679170 RepID=UPI003D05D2B6
MEEKQNSFTKVDNSLLEGIQKYKFTTNQLKIIMVVWRYTFGFHRKAHELSLSFFEEATYLDRKSVSRSLKSLKENKVLIEIQRSKGNKGAMLAINTNLNQWTVDKYLMAKNDEGSGQNDTTSSGQYATTSSGQNDTQERKVKENIKKKRYIDLPIDGSILLVIYNSYFYEKFNKDHMQVSTEKESFILEQINLIEQMDDCDIEEFEEIVNFHFDNLPKGNNGSILAFIQAFPRYLHMLVSEGTL